MFLNASSPNVGIGTSTPSATLTVDGYGEMDRLHLGDRSSISASSLSAVTTTIDDGDWAVDGSSWYLNRLSDNQTLRTATQTLKMTDAGNLGVNTDSPSAQLHHVGSVRFSGLSAGLLTVDTQGNVGVPISSATDSQTLSFENSSSSQASLVIANNLVPLNLLASGTFSFDTSASSTDTLVLGSSYDSNNLIDGDGDSQVQLIDLDGTATASDTVVISTAGNEQVRLLASGNVGIGTSTPSTTITVDGYGEMDRLHLGDRSSISASSLSAVTTTIDDGDWAVDESSWYLNRLSDNQTLRTATQTLKMTDAGNLGVNTDSPAVELDIVGDIQLTGSYTSSDRRYKKNIVPLINLIPLIQQLHPVRYRWNQTDFPLKNFSDQPTLGFIAQEVETVFPALVSTNADGFKSINYMKLNVVLIGGIQETQTQLNNQSKRITAIETFLKTKDNKTHTIHEQ